MSFWDTLQKPFFVLAPMAEVTDPVFRRIIAKYSAHKRNNGSIGAADVMWTEFVSADGLIRADERGKKKLLADLAYSEGERPIVAQLFSSTPRHMEEAARLCKELGFDGVDINMGCPDRSVEKQGAGAAHMKDPSRAREIIEAAVCGAGGLPVSVKTRLGYNSDTLDDWLRMLLETDLAAITIHARTRKEMSKVPAHWGRIADAVRIRNEMHGDEWKQDNKNRHPALIIGNGDVENIEEAREKAQTTGADGIMLGRAIFGNPWLFHPERDANAMPLADKLSVLVEHTELFESSLSHKDFAIMKKHYKAYVQGFPGAAELRARLMDASGARAVRAVVRNFLA